MEVLSYRKLCSCLLKPTMPDPPVQPPPSCPKAQDGLSDPQALGSNLWSLKAFLSSAVSLSTPSPGTQGVRARPYVRVTTGGHATPFLRPPPLPAGTTASLPFEDGTDGPGPREQQVQPPRVAPSSWWESPGLKMFRDLRDGSVVIQVDHIHLCPCLGSTEPLPPIQSWKRREELWADKANGDFNKELSWVYLKK